MLREKHPIRNLLVPNLIHKMFDNSFGLKIPQNMKSYGHTLEAVVEWPKPKMPKPVINTFNAPDAIIDDMTSSRFNKEL